MTQTKDDEDLEQTRALLEEWGAWQRSLPGQRQGYSGQAAHLSIPGGSGNDVMPENALGEQMDRVLGLVRTDNAAAFEVLFRYYCQGLSIRDVAQDMRLSRTRCDTLKQIGESATKIWWRIYQRRSA
ncbi:MAG: hypothetical protein U5L11_02685 [Arhodomonas sp.]|nr:hypothetical protein [Arhodomonas sp.]